MKRSVLAIALVFVLTPAALQAQSAQQPAEQTAEQTPLRERLMPSSAVLQVTAPAPSLEEKAAEKDANQPVMANGRSGVGYMIAGLALFVAGLIIDDDDAGTVLVLAGAGIGAYGLYLHFR